MSGFSHVHLEFAVSGNSLKQATKGKIIYKCITNTVKNVKVFKNVSYKGKYLSSKPEIQFKKCKRLLKITLIVTKI